MKFHKRWKFFLVWSTLAMAYLLGYDYLHNQPQDFYHRYPEYSQDLVFWVWSGVNVIISLTCGAAITALDSFIDWMHERRHKQDDDDV